MVKLARGEEEPPAAWAFVSEASRLISSELLITEVPRALRRIAATERDIDLTACLMKAEMLLEAIALHTVDRPTLRRAGRRFEPHLRSLDAIHVMTALELLSDQPISFAFVWVRGS